MGLAHRIIPTILCRGRQQVKGKAFNSWRSVGIAITAAKIHARRQADEVCVLDLEASQRGNGPNLELVSELAEDFFSPLAVGGGVRSVEDVKALLRAGADKVVIGTWAPAVVMPAARIVGSQAIVASVDVFKGKVAWQCGRALSSIDATEYAKKMEDEGAGEILLQSIERDGTCQGYDLDLIGAVRSSVGIPVIASCGAGNYQHMVEAIQAGASAVAAGAMFQFEDATPRGAALFLQKAGLEVRIP